LSNKLLYRYVHQMVKNGFAYQPPSPPPPEDPEPQVDAIYELGPRSLEDFWGSSHLRRYKSKLVNRFNIQIRRLVQEERKKVENDPEKRAIFDSYKYE